MAGTSKTMTFLHSKLFAFFFFLTYYIFLGTRFKMKTLEITSCYYLFPGDGFLQDKQDQIPEIWFYLCILRHKQDQILESWFFLCILRQMWKNTNYLCLLCHFSF